MSGLIEQLQRGVDTNEPPDKTDRIMTEAADEIRRLREWIVMADNRLEVADCPLCVEVARSYLKEALAKKRK